MKFHCYTLGCKVNQYETQAMERQLIGLGHTPAEEAESDALPDEVLYAVTYCAYT